MFYAFGNDIKFTRIEDDIAAAKLDCHLAGQDQKEIVGIRV